MGHVDEGWGLRMRASAQRRRAVRIRGAGAHGRRAVCMGGGRCAWEEGGVHERRAAHMGGEIGRAHV